MTDERMEKLLDLAMYIHAAQTAKVVSTAGPIDYATPKEIASSIIEIRQEALAKERELIHTKIEELLKELTNDHLLHGNAGHNLQDSRLPWAR